MSGPENGVIKDEDNFYDILDEGTGEIEYSEISEDFEADDIDTVADTDILRIQQALTSRWSGVRSCGRRERAQREVLGDLERWAAQVLAENQGMRLVRKGIVNPGSVRYHYRNKRDRWGRRSCRGWCNFTGFVELAMP